jgi:membrane associated rhomboid family serine protease
MFPISVPDRKGVPPLTAALVALCVSSWIASFYFAGSIDRLFGYVPDWLLGRVDRPETFRLVPLWLTPVTSILVHEGFFHVAINMVWLWLFGRALEHSLGTARYALLLIGAVYGSAIFQSAALGGLEPVVGASGMVAGILGAFLVVHPKAAIKTLFIIIFRVAVIPVPAVFFLLGWWVLDLLTALDAISRGRPDGIAHPAHLSGFLVGMGLVAFLRPPQLALFDAGKPWPELSSFSMTRNTFFDAGDPQLWGRRLSFYEKVRKLALYALAIFGGVVLIMASVRWVAA